MNDLNTNNPTDDGGRAAWIRHWAVVGPKLAQIRAQELRSMSPEEAQLAVETLLDLVDECPPRPPTSGLIEYQRRIRGKKS